MVNRTIHGAGSIIKTALGIDRLPAGQVKARLDVCRKCPGNHAVWKRGQIHTCGPMLKSLLEKNRKSCGCVLRAKARDRKEDCPFGYWPKLEKKVDSVHLDARQCGEVPVVAQVEQIQAYGIHRLRRSHERRVVCRTERREIISQLRADNPAMSDTAILPAKSTDPVFAIRDHPEGGSVQCKSLYDWFDRVVVINLDRRPDRWDRLKRHLSEVGWPFRWPERVQAVDGRLARPPKWWRAGAPAWGCHQSHLRVLEQAIQGQLNSILVLEDDVCFTPKFRQQVEAFLEELPQGWHQIYLGGQHIRASKHPPTAVNIHVLQAHNVNRLHAYAAQGAFIQAAYQHLCDYEAQAEQHRRRGPQGGEKAHHVDHRMGVLHESKKWSIFCPTTWLAGQGADRSDILGKSLGTRYWQWRGRNKVANSRPQARRLLFLAHPRSGTHYVAKLCQSYGLDVGHERMRADGICSWMLAADADHSPYGDGTVFRDYEFETVVRIVRHPLKVLASSIHTENHGPEEPTPIDGMSLREYMLKHTFKERSWAYRRHFVSSAGYYNGSAGNPYEQAVEVLLGWDKLIENRNPRLTIHIEKASDELREGLGLAQLQKPAPPTGLGRRRHPDLTWEELQKHLRQDLIQALQDYSSTLGYDLDDPSKLSGHEFFIRSTEALPDTYKTQGEDRHVVLA